MYFEVLLKGVVWETWMNVRCFGNSSNELLSLSWVSRAIIIDVMFVYVI